GLDLRLPHARPQAPAHRAAVDRLVGRALRAGQGHGGVPGRRGRHEAPPASAPSPLPAEPPHPRPPRLPVASRAGPDAHAAPRARPRAQARRL
ncbi:MAG: hypothetical protein AVDCRST_MAG13-1181, partial [uncultured Solirubrobacteraceae bacterium]